MSMDTEAAREKQIILYTAPLIPNEDLAETLQARKAEMTFYWWNQEWKQGLALGMAGKCSTISQVPSSRRYILKNSPLY